MDKLWEFHKKNPYFIDSLDQSIVISNSVLLKCTPKYVFSEIPFKTKFREKLSHS